MRALPKKIKEPKLKNIKRGAAALSFFCSFCISAQRKCKI
jgi:hypothetical protein